MTYCGMSLFTLKPLMQATGQSHKIDGGPFGEITAFSNFSQCAPRLCGFLARGVEDLRSRYHATSGRSKKFLKLTYRT
jgi:hypothetical protein